MFDSGANVTMIDSVILKQVQIKGRKGKLDLKGINATEGHDSVICDFIIIKPETIDAFRINGVPSVKFDRPALVESFPILRKFRLFRLASCAQMSFIDMGKCKFPLVRIKKSKTPT